MSELNKVYVGIQYTSDTRGYFTRQSVIMVLYAAFGQSIFPVESTAQELETKSAYTNISTGTIWRRIQSQGFHGTCWGGTPGTMYTEKGTFSILHDTLVEFSRRLSPRNIAEKDNTSPSASLEVAGKDQANASSSLPDAIEP